MNSRFVALVAATLLAAGAAPGVSGQTDAPMTESEDTHYYDFWPGNWAEIVDGRPDPTADRFEVRRVVSQAAFEETWHLVYDGDDHATVSMALRAWDQVTGSWRFVWIGDNGLFQVWEGEKVDGDWYIVKEFEIGGQTILSRQAWIPDGDDRVVRLHQRSTDSGRTWTTRYRTVFERISR